MLLMIKSAKRSPPCRPSATASSVLHAAIARALAKAMENVVTRYRRVMRGKFIVDALRLRASRPPWSPMGRRFGNCELWGFESCSACEDAGCGW